jgi:hypothetical protein
LCFSLPVARAPGSAQTTIEASRKPWHATRRGLLHTPVHSAEEQPWRGSAPGAHDAVREEYQEALALIQDLRGLAPGLPEFDRKVQTLILTVEHHMTVEETEMFPLAEAELEEDLTDLRDEMQDVKERLLAS